MKKATIKLAALAMFLGSSIASSQAQNIETNINVVTTAVPF